MEKIQGLINAPFTAFNPDGSLNTRPVPQYAKMLAAQGVCGVFVNGSSGEGYLMTDEERIENAQAWLDAAPAGFKVFVHVGSNSIKSSQYLARHAAASGAYAISVMGPTFPKIGRLEELVEYCAQIAAAAPELPFYYYHIPVFNGLYFSMLDFLKAVDGRIPNFAGIKYTFESLYEYTQCRRYKDGRFDMLHGQDETLLPSLALGGAQGCIGGTFNYAASLYTGIVSAFNNGELDKARALQSQSMDMIDVIAAYRGNIVAGKQIMKMIGLDLGKNRAPFRNLSEEEYVEVERRLQGLGFFNYANKVS